MSSLINTADKAAVGLSTFCAIQCLTLPLMLAFLPTLSWLSIIADETFHLWLLMAVLPVSFFALATGYVVHKNSSIVVLGLTGILLLDSAVIIGHDLLGESGEVILTVIGSVLVTVGHIGNLKRRRQCAESKS